MAYYVTRKRVNNYIRSKTHLFKNTSEFISEVDTALVDLNEFPEGNRNQIRFFERVKKQLEF